MDLPLIIGFVSAALFLTAALLSVAYFRFCSRLSDPDDLEMGTQNTKVADGPDNTDSDQSQTHTTKGAVRRFDWSEIKSLTANLSPAAVIGEGGFSTVYLATPLRGSSSPIAAVKVHRSSERLHRAFRQELDVLLRLRHTRIVRLLGYCDDQEDGALVLEYVPGGNLHDILHGGGGAVLPWARRMSIAYRLALAVEYLHEGCDPQVVHGDIKASNVLLDGRMDPKLCDFGSARMGFSAAVRPASGGGSTMVGSPGYVDPHYLRTGIVSKKSDMYSFGVLLLELITGAEAFCSETERLLTAEVGVLLREGRVGELVVDPRLGRDYDPAEAAAVVEVAAGCVGQQPSLRPSMAEVLRIIREKVPSCISTVDVGKLNQKPDSL